ncbi:MAG: Holliday junction branch migration protein RuvA [Phycisphaeraceae bacterium]
MIARIHGILDSIDDGVAFVRIGDPATGALTYEVRLPSFAVTRLMDSIGGAVTLHTFNWLESQGQGSSMIPRLAGFLTAGDLRFYELFTTCKGIGYKRALRAFALDTATIAGAIADRDVSLLQSLPEVGKRTAETIVLTLKDKVNSFVSAAAYGATGDGKKKGSAKPQAAGGAGSMAREAMETLLALGENRVQAVQWIDAAMSEDDRPKDVTELINRIYRIKAGA